MSEIKRLLNQSSHYFIGQVVVMAAGFISFPILTRIFSVSDYGILGLITITILIAIAIIKLGFPNSIVRFYAEFKSKNQFANFYSTILLGGMGVSALISALFVFTIQIVGGNFIGNNIVNLLSLASVLMFTGCSSDILTSFIRAEQRTKLYNLISILRRYGALALGIFFVFYVFKDLFGFFLGQVISGIIVFSFLLYVSCKKQNINIRNFSSWIFKDSIKFGFPLIWAELGHLVLHYIDRYLIQLFLGSVSLGLYTAGYNLATYVTEIIMYPVNYAMTPIYMDILVNKGEEETKEFFTKSFRYFLLILSAIVFGFIAVGRDLISLLATKKYLEAYPILPYVIIGQSIYACTIILNNGLFIRRKTYIYTTVMLITCLLSIGINMILIPRHGIIGAGMANLISNIFYALVITYYAFKEFSFRIDYPRILLYLGIGGAMYLVMSAIDVGAPIYNLIAKISAGAVFYSGLVLILDKEVRTTVLRMIDRSGGKTPGLPLQ